MADLESAIFAVLFVVLLAADMIVWRMTKREADRARGNAALAEAYRDEMADMLAKADGAQR